MNVIKRNVNGSSYVGAFLSSSDKFTLTGRNASAKDEAMIKEALGTELLRLSVNSSNLIGIYTVLNSNGIILPELSLKEELKEVYGAKERVSIGIIKCDMNAFGNNVLANDRIAIINPGFPHPVSKQIEDILGVETIKRAIGGYDTVGASNILTNKGMILNNRASEEDIEFAKQLVKNVSQSTANLGSGFIGLATAANSKGLIVGEDTTGFELARMEQGLSDE